MLKKLHCGIWGVCGGIAAIKQVLPETFSGNKIPGATD